MKNLGKILKSNVTPLIPFAFLSKNLNNSWGEPKSLKYKVKNNSNWAVSLCLTTAMTVYGFGAFFWKFFRLP